MGEIILNPPAVEPVSLAELKQFLRVDVTDTSRDDVIETLGMAARAWAETHTQRRFVQQTWRLLIDFFPGYIDMKLAGSKVSSPFVSGSNAVLVGIRYAIALPNPPAWNLVAFNYQNANGQFTSMITGPATIASVQNVLGQPLQLTTVSNLGLQTGAGIVLAGNTSLLNFLGGEIFQTINVLGPTTIVLNGTVGDGVTSISGGGTATGYNFVYDLQSNPARLMPVFGQMWPVARVVANAVQVDWELGYAMPLTVSVDNGSPPNADRITASGYAFEATDIGRPISIEGAGINGGPLNTVIAGLDSPADGGALLRYPAKTLAQNAKALLVNNPNAQPQHWALIKGGIKMLTAHWYETGVPVDTNIPMQVKAILGPVRDLRF